jgi:hypothetical protein
MGAIIKEGPIFVEGHQSFVSGRDVKADEQEGWSVTHRPYRPKPSEDQLRDLCTDACTCLLAGNRVLMADGSHRPVESLKAGDMVMTMSGPDKVRLVEATKLGMTRRVIELRGNGDECLFISDEHPVWVSRRGADGNVTENWGTYNMNHLSYELRNSAEPVHIDEPFLLKIDLPEQLAHVSGWIHARPIYHHLDPSTPLYHLVLDREHAFFAEGFALFSQAREPRASSAPWQGLNSDAMAQGFVRRVTAVCA